MSKKTLTIKQKLARLRQAANRFNTIADELGAISITKAGEVRGTTRSAVTQLVTRERLDAVYVFGSPVLIRDQVENLEKQNSGPTPK